MKIVRACKLCGRLQKSAVCGRSETLRLRKIKMAKNARREAKCGVRKRARKTEYADFKKRV